MIVSPNLLTHPKFLQLQRAIGLSAARVLLNLWAHCQQDRRCEFWLGADADYVEAVACWEGEAGVLFAALDRYRWIHVEPTGIRIHDWNETNGSLRSSWKNGDRGADKTRGSTHGSTRNNTGSTHGITDRRGSDRSTKGGPPLGPPLTSKDADPAGGLQTEEAPPGSRARKRMFDEQKERIGFLMARAKRLAGRAAKHPLTEAQIKTKTQVDEELRKLLDKQQRGEL